MNNGSLTLNGGGNSLFANGLTNSGSVSIGDGDLADFSGGSFTNLSGGLLSGGSLTLAGTMVIADADGVVHAIDADTSLTLSGAGQLVNSSGSALDLSRNAGNLTLQNGAFLETTAGVDFVNDGGALTVDGPTLFSVGSLGSGTENFVNGAVAGGTAGSVTVQNGGDLEWEAPSLTASRTAP